MADTERTLRILKVKFASLLFGFGSWITIVGFWAELPLLIQSLPEKWTLPSQLTLFIQAANLGPLLYWLCKCANICNEVSATHIQMVIGFISCLVLVFLWDQTVYFLNAYRSLPLMIAAFGLAILDCTSSVTFLPFMARLKSRHLTPYLIGEGLSGFIPIIVATVQGSSEPSDCVSQSGKLTTEERSLDEFSSNLHSPSVLFGPSIFFTSLLITLLISWLAFFYLNYSPTARKEYLPSPSAANATEMRPLADGDTSDNNNKKSDCEQGAHSKCIKGPSESDTIKPQLNRKQSMYPETIKMSDMRYTSLQCVLIYACFTTFGIFPALQSYANLPYGSWALHWTVILTGLAYPVGCFIALFKEITSVKWITIWTLVATFISIYILVASVMSPEPIFVEKGGSSYPLVGMDSRTLGGIMMIAGWTLYYLILSYVKTIITVLLSRARGEEALFTVGLLTQVASVVGAAFMFIAVNYFKWFHDDQC